MTAVIEASSLSKTYGTQRALDDFSLTVPSGVIFGILGPNGAGKTTAIEIMLGLRTSDQGSVTVLGENPEKHYMRIAPRVGAMLQQGGINTGLKPREALALYSSFYSQSLDIDDLLERVGLKGVTTIVRRLSGGQAQSLSLALAIIGKPELVFLDEPTVGMDPRARRRTWEIIEELRTSGTTVVLTTHLMDEAETLCDEIAIVSKGRVIAQGDTAALISSHQDAVDLEFASPVVSSDLEHVLGVSCEQRGALGVRVTVDPTPDFLVRVAAYAQSHNLLVTRFSSQSKNLEDVFIELTDETQPSDESTSK